MKISVLERLLTVDRKRPKMTELGVFAPPVAIRFASPPQEAPWVTSLSTGRFTLTRPDRNGDVGQSMFEMPPQEEDPLLGLLFSTLWQLGEKHGWPNRCSSIEEAVKRMSSFGLEPKALVVPFTALKAITGSELTEEEADQVSLSKGCVAEVNGVKVIPARNALPDGSALLATARPLVGYYTRVNTYVGVTILQADRSVVLVGGDAVA